MPAKRTQRALPMPGAGWRRSGRASRLLLSSPRPGVPAPLRVSSASLHLGPAGLRTECAWELISGAPGFLRGFTATLLVWPRLGVTAHGAVRVLQAASARVQPSFQKHGK